MVRHFLLKLCKIHTCHAQFQSRGKKYWVLVLVRTLMVRSRNKKGRARITGVYSYWKHNFGVSHAKNITRIDVLTRIKFSGEYLYYIFDYWGSNNRYFYFLRLRCTILVLFLFLLCFYMCTLSATALVNFLL